MFSFLERGWKYFLLHLNERQGLHPDYTEQRSCLNVAHDFSVFKFFSLSRESIKKVHE